MLVLKIFLCAYVGSSNVFDKIIRTNCGIYWLLLLIPYVETQLQAWMRIIYSNWDLLMVAAYSSYYFMSLRISQKRNSKQVGIL